MEIHKFSKNGVEELGEEWCVCPLHLAAAAPPPKYIYLILTELVVLILPLPLLVTCSTLLLTATTGFPCV